jgi:hypothetical protein
MRFRSIDSLLPAVVARLVGEYLERLLLLGTQMLGGEGRLNTSRLPLKTSGSLGIETRCRPREVLPFLRVVDNVDVVIRLVVVAPTTQLGVISADLIWLGGLIVALEPFKCDIPILLSANGHHVQTPHTAHTYLWRVLAVWSGGIGCREYASILHAVLERDVVDLLCDLE